MATASRGAKVSDADGIGKMCYNIPGFWLLFLFSKERDKVLATQGTLEASVKAQKVARAALEVHNEWLERQNNSFKSKIASSTERK